MENFFYLKEQKKSFKKNVFSEDPGGGEGVQGGPIPGPEYLKNG